MVCGFVCAGDICEMTSSVESFFSCENGIKRGHASLIRQIGSIPYLERGTRRHLISYSTNAANTHWRDLLITNMVGDENEQVW